MSVASPIIDFIDGPLRHIHLKSPADWPPEKIINGVLVWNSVDDIYTEVRHLRRVNEELRHFDAFCSALPLIDRGEGATTGRGLILLKSTRIVPFDSDQTQRITGELLSDSGESGTRLIKSEILSQGVKVKINYEPPPATEVITIVSNGLTQQQLRDAIIQGLQATNCE